MARTSLLPLLLVLGGLFPSAASACFVPPQPFSPQEFQRGVILEGVVQSTRRNGQRVEVTIEVRRVRQGSYTGKTYAFAFLDSMGDGPCPPRSTRVVPDGQKLVVYLEKRAETLTPIGWMHSEDARRQDSRLSRD